MAKYKLSFEINEEGNSPLEVAKQVQKMIKEGGDYQWYVQDEDTGEVFSVDLEEEDEDAVLPVNNYEPFIN